ncbi:hypothetical protein JCM10207_001177 [Rhodosporidiobolus poonsookiae]
MPPATASKATKRKSTGSTSTTNKKQRRASPSSASDDGGGSDASIGSPSASEHASDSDEDKPKKRKAAPKKGKAKEVSKKGTSKVNGKGKGKATKAKGKGKKAKADSDGDSFIAGSGSEDEDEDDGSSDGGLNTRIVREVKTVAAPKGKADTEVILQSTLDFLADLKDNNEREWFQERDALYRHAFLNFKTFVTAWVPKGTEADWSLPHLPAKDLMHRIYRDVRFSKDKTPYKTYFCASTSRTGRKGPYGLYYIHIQPNNRSFLGCGCWSPGTNELKLFRNAILRDPKPWRDVLAQPDFVKLFGEPKPRMDKKRSSVFGGSDELKNAPKLEGVDKSHKDIDLLKCRSFAVETPFTDEQVTSPDFLDTVKDAMATAAPFVQFLNDIISPPESDDDDGDDGANDAEDDEEEEEEEEEEDEP